MKHGLNLLRIALAASVAIMTVATQARADSAPAKSTQAPLTAKNDSTAVTRSPGGFTLWETVIRTDRTEPGKDKEPKVSRQAIRECIRADDMKASTIAGRSAATAELAGSCWINQEREDATRSQIKWGCQDGTTFEIATRREADNRFGYHIVVNSPAQGSLSIRGESIRVAESCEPPKSTNGSAKK